MTGRPITQIVKKCLTCGKTFWIFNCRKNTAKYCSRKCYIFSSKEKHYSPNTEFKKGHITWSSGKHHSEITKKRMKKSKGANGKWKKSDGRWLIFTPDHPFATKQGCVRKSRLIVEKCLGRYLTSQEIIHHINGNPSNDCPENLYLFSSPNEHNRYDNLKNKPILKSNL